jgi:hypothetical protein
MLSKIIFEFLNFDLIKTLFDVIFIQFTDIYVILFDKSSKDTQKLGFNLKI